MPQKNLRYFTKNKPSFCQNKKIVAITSHFLKFQAQAAIKILISSPTCPLSRFLESLKSDLKGSVPNISISQQTYATRAQARSAIFEYIEVFYNKIRRHSTIDYCSPSDYEKKFYQDNIPNLILSL